MKRKEKLNNQEKIDQFCSVDDLKGIASLLNFKAKDLSYILYSLNGGRENQYKTYEIKKKDGGARKISAPQSALKEIQRRLNDLLKIIYWEKPCVHSFLHKKSIVTNAIRHTKKRYILNIDLKDFFPSINFGRVRGMFIARPYGLKPKAATIIAQIACFNNELPQGSPCSPIISNMICSKMDKQLQLLSKRVRCTYTRYADDITFSTNMPEFPNDVGKIDGNSISLSDDFSGIIKSNGFQINHNKVRLQTRDMRQEVTGLIVNEFANPRRKLIRQVRAMLHAWDKYGLENAEKEYINKYCLNQNHAKNNDDVNVKDFKKIVEGKISFISMVRNEKENKEKIIKYYKRISYSKEDISLRLYNAFYEQIMREGDLPIIRTEGHTDWMHLIAAWEYFSQKEEFKDLKFDFFCVKKDICFGNKKLMNFLENINRLKPFNKKIICIFDSDDNKINKAHNNPYIRKWANNVYSFVLPNPSKFNNKPISIEFLYPKSFITKKDENGRRLFFSDEFKEDGSHLEMADVKYGYLSNLKKKMFIGGKPIQGELKIIDNNVFKIKDGKYISLALSKSKFAYNILKKQEGFINPSFNEFEKIFKIIKEIIES